ncbi:MAG: hypothetical protein S4CHLAM123_04120 [Chlamydiales bacterium]|nr:hypothetical protein [Chlamydiales bacterium]
MHRICFSLIFVFSLLTSSLFSEVKVLVDGVGQANFVPKGSLEGSTTDIQAASMSGLVSLTAGQIVKVLVVSSGSLSIAELLQVESSNLRLHLLRKL